MKPEPISPILFFSELLALFELTSDLVKLGITESPINGFFSDISPIFVAFVFSSQPV